MSPNGSVLSVEWPVALVEALPCSSLVEVTVLPIGEALMSDASGDLSPAVSATASITEVVSG